MKAVCPFVRRVQPRNSIPAVLPPLVDVASIVRAAAPFEGACGVYFLQRTTPSTGGQIVYVGQSTNVFARVAQHAANKRFDSWSFIECHENQLNVIESLYIHWLRPEYNNCFSTLHSRINDAQNEMTAPIPRKELQHLLDALAPTNGWSKRKRAA